MYIYMHLQIYCLYILRTLLERNTQYARINLDSMHHAMHFYSVVYLDRNRTISLRGVSDAILLFFSGEERIFKFVSEEIFKFVSGENRIFKFVSEETSIFCQPPQTPPQTA